ncbi:MAG: hypothetical protein ACRDSJ_00955, partial [Rubrobacteraceae bacterium]
MNEESITSLGNAGLRSLADRAKRGVKRFFGRGEKAPPDVSPELRVRAVGVIREFAEENEALFERVSRFEERAERLRDDGGAKSE